jgi:hypothetical protein
MWSYLVQQPYPSGGKKAVDDRKVCKLVRTVIPGFDQILGIVFVY